MLTDITIWDETYKLTINHQCADFNSRNTTTLNKHLNNSTPHWELKPLHLRVSGSF